MSNGPHRPRKPDAAGEPVERKEFKGFQPPEGSKENVGEVVEFWKPKARGDALVGHVKAFGTNSIGEHVEMMPALVWPKGADVPQGFLALNVGLNATLRRRLLPEHIGREVSVVFDGAQTTPKGAMRLFRLFVLTPEQFDGYLEKHAPGLAEQVKKHIEKGKRQASASGPGIEEWREFDEEEEDLPF